MALPNPTPNSSGTYDYHERIVLPPRAAAPSGTLIALPRPAAGAATAARRANVVLAALQLVVGYQWLISGVDKLLYGRFPDQLGQLITGVAAGGRVPDFFAQFLRDVVLPNSYAFGVTVETGETLTGLGLLAGALLTLAGPAIARRMGARAIRSGLGLLGLLTAGAALGSIFMGLNYYMMDGLPLPWFQPGFAYGGAIHPGLFLALASAVILGGQIGGRLARR